MLHYAEDPAAAIAEAARMLRLGGRMLIIDFAPHNLERLRSEHAHRRLGFAREQVAAWLDEAGIECTHVRELAPPRKGDDQLTVSLWLGQDRRIRTDWPLKQQDREVA